MKKALALILALVMVLAMTPAAFAADEELSPGVTVTAVSEADINGEYGAAYKDAGYKATFVYEDTTGKEIEFVKLNINEVYYTVEDVASYVEAGYPRTIDITPKTAYEYRSGMITAFNNAPGATETTGVYELTDSGEGVYTISMPIAPQAYNYRYNVKYVGEEVVRVLDPANPVAKNPNTGEDVEWNMFYVGTAADAPVNMQDFYPVEEAYQGTVTYTSVTASNGLTQDIGIYLPYNYDENKVYNVVYASHGSGGDEVEWFTLGSLANIMDNLVKAGKIKNTIVVTMNNNAPFNNLSNLEEVARNVADVLVPFMEANYPVSNEVSDRAVFGLSAGGSMSETLLQTIPEEFGYVGISSVGRSFPISGAKADLDDIKNTVVAYYGGSLDFRTANTKNLYDEVAALGGVCTFTQTDGGHDWTGWSEAIDDFLTNVVWTAEEAAKITEAETYEVNAPVSDGDVTAQITTADGTPAFTDETGVATAADGVVTIDAGKISGINFNGTTDLYIGNTRIATYVIPELSVDSQLFGSVFTNGKSTLKYSYDQKVDYAEDSKATLTLNLDGLDNALIDSSKAKVILDEGDGYFPEEYKFLATTIGAFENGEATYALKQGDLEMDVQGYLTKDVNSGREWSCLGGDGHGNYWYNLTVSGITYNGLPVGSQTFRLHIYVYGYDYTSDANNLYTAEGTKITPVKSETGSGVQQGSEVVWTHADTPILCDWVQDDIFVTWPTGSDRSDITADDVTITLNGEYGDTKVLEAGKDYTVYASAGETQIAMSYINWPFIPVYTTMTVEVAGESKTIDIGSVYVYEAQQGGGGVTVDGTVTVYSFYGLKDVTPIVNFVTYTLSANVDGATKYYAEDENGNGILVDSAAEAKTFDGNGVNDCNVKVIENSIYVTTRRTTQYEDKTVDGETVTFTKTYTRGGMKNPSQTDTDLLETLPGYVIPYGTSNWITNEKWAWQEGVNEGWLAMHFVNEGNRASYQVTAGTTTQLELQNEVEGVKYMIVGHPTSDETTVTEDGLLTIGADETGFCGVMAYVEGDPYAKSTVTFSIKAPANTVTAGSATAKSGEGETVTIPVTYNNADPASSIRLKIGTALPIQSIDSKYEHEFNPALNYIVVYTTEEFNKGDELFTITFDLSDVDDGTYKVKPNIVDATDAQPETLALIGVPGYVVINNWTDNGDGTATNGKTGITVIIGEDGIPGTDDDNKIVNPAGTVIKEDVEVQTAEDGSHYVDLGNGFILTAGEDGKLGTTDDVVTFGEYQQSADPEVGKEPIEWYVLAIDGDMATLVTKDVIDGLKFNLELEDGNDWANSNYRNWLNSYEGGVSNSGDTVGFYDTAFSDADKDKILPSKVNMSSDSQFVAYNRRVTENWWQYYSTNTGNDTIDNVYALSGEEVFEYFGLSRIATLEELGHAPELYTNGYTGATEYAQSVGVKINTGGNGPSYVGYADSWTRSPGEENCGVFLGSVGSLNSGREVTRSYGARPVVTVELASYIKGDVNRDGTVSNIDLILVARYLVDLEDFDSQQLKIADFNNDGTVSNKDLILIARYIVAA